MTCPACGSSEISPSAKRVYDDRYGYPGTFSLLRCTKCDHRFLDTKFSAEQIRDLYSRYYPRSTFKVEEHRPHQERSGFSAWLDGARSRAYCWVPKNVRILDIGCGFGETLGYHQARGCEAYGVEADENILRVAERFGYKVRAGLFDPTDWEQSFFDYVTMDQVIEHVQDPVATLRGIAQVLKPGGSAILGTPNAGGWGATLFGQRWINWHAPYHQQFFSIRSMRTASERAGLVMEKTFTLTSSPWLYYQWIHLLTCPSEGNASGFWAAASGAKLNRMQESFMRVLARLNMLKVNHVVTRLFDSIGMGDSQLFILRKPM